MLTVHDVTRNFTNVIEWDLLTIYRRVIEKRETGYTSDKN